MKPSDFERHIKENTTPQFFSPDEDKWLMLEKDLDKRKRRRFFLFRVTSLSIVTLLILAGLISLYQSRPTVSKTTIKAKDVQSIRNDTALPSSGKPNTSVNPEQDSVPQSAQYSTLQASVVSKDSGMVQSGNHINKQTVAEVEEREIQSHYFLPHQDSLFATRVITPLLIFPTPPDSAYTTSIDLTTLPKTNGLSTPHRPLIFGVSALYCFPGISKSQFRISLDAKKYFSQNVFAAIQLVASQAKISESDVHQYQVIELMPLSVPPQQTGTRDVQATYSGKAYTLGIAPSIGIDFGKRVSLSAGADLQHTLANSIPLTNKEEFNNQINDQLLVKEKQEISSLEIGLQSRLQLHINKQVAFNLLYRYALSDYFKETSFTTRNSFVAVGLSYNFK